MNNNNKPFIVMIYLNYRNNYINKDKPPSCFMVTYDSYEIPY